VLSCVSVPTRAPPPRSRYNDPFAGGDLTHSQRCAFVFLIENVMKLFLVLWLSISGVTISAAVPCPATYHFSQDSALQFEHDWLNALQQNDAAALDCILADEFEDTSWKGELRPKSQVLRELSGRPAQYKQTLCDLEVDLVADVAVVHGVNVITDQQAHEVIRIRFTDVLRFSDHRWRAVAAQETAQQRP